MGGRKLEAYFADNKAQPGEAVSAVRKLADVDQVEVIIGQQVFFARRFNSTGASMDSWDGYRASRARIQHGSIAFSP